MTEAQRAALRILESTPRERIRTHEQKIILKQWGYKRSPDESETLRTQLLDMQRRGYTRRQMIEECKCGVDTLIKLLGRCTVKRGRHARSR